jgi:GGDEF domain-containing protein
MAKAASKGTKQPLRATHEPRARTPFTSSDAAACALLLLTVAGAATEAIQLTGNARLLILGATALTLLMGFWRPRMWLAIAAIIIIAGGAATGAVAIKTGGTTVLWIAVSAAIAAALGFLAIWVSTLLRRIYRRMSETRRVIDALTQIDPATGVFRPHAGRDRLRAEVTRAVRYRRPFTLLVGKARDWEIEVEHRGMSTAQEVYAETLRTATTVLRNNDVIASEPDYSFIVILPETTAEGGEYAAQHIQEAVQGLLDVRFGLVQCPEDGETEGALLREAYQALTFAEMANLPIVSRRALIADGS